MSNNINIVFVCQAGELEAKATILAASLRYYNKQAVNLYAAVPNPTKWGELHADTKQLLSDLDVHILIIENPICDDYPIGNKLAALQALPDDSPGLFLDSDIVAMAPLKIEEWRAYDVVCKPADFATFAGSSLDWQTVYQVCEVAIPKRKCITTVSQEISYPYFNAGALYARNPTSFASTWIEYALRIEQSPRIENKRPWLDQIAIPVALQALESDYALMDERYNYPCHVKSLQGDVTFCHYHWPKIIRQEPRLNNLLVKLVRENRYLLAVLKKYPQFAELLHPYKISGATSTLKCLGPWNSSPQAQRLVLTGLPRSGTSLLCNLLHRLDNTIIINEPTEIFSPLINQKIPYDLDIYYREQITSVFDGQGIINKLTNGQVTEDTAQGDTRSQYFPSITKPSFTFGVKNPLAFMFRSADIKKAMPSAKLIKSIRHPYDCINSWQNTFPHLQNVDLTKFPIPASSLLERDMAKALQDIANEENTIVRQALLWRAFAEQMIAQSGIATVVKYEELCADPAAVIENITQSELCANDKQAIQNGVCYRSRKSEIPKEIKQIINDICWPTADYFGYQQS